MARIGRRRFLGGAAGAAVAAGAYAWRIEPHWVDWVRRDLPIAGLPDDWVGRTLAQVSDLHAGDVDSDYLRRQLRQLGELRPDAVVFTGDFLTCRDGEPIDEAARVVEALPTPPRGCVAVLGNHDYSMRDGWSNRKTADRLVARLAALGIHVLRNERRDLGGLEVIGLDDLWGPSFDLPTAMRGRDRNRPAIVLCHNPDGVDAPFWDGYRGWILAGHTHGGQVRLPLLPPILPVNNRRYVAGEYDLGDGRRLYVNRGLGHLTRVRFNVRPEITLFTLVRA